MAFTSEVLAAQVEAGHIRVTPNAEVEVSAKASPTGKEAKASYTKLEALDAAGMAFLCGGKLAPATAKPEEGKDERTDAEKANGAADYFNYGYDLEARQRVRTAIMNSLAGPEKDIKASVKGLQVMGYDADAIVAAIVGSPKFASVENIEALVRGAL